MDLGPTKTLKKGTRESVRVIRCITRPLNPSSEPYAAATNQDYAAEYMRKMHAILVRERESLTLTALALDTTGICREGVRAPYGNWLAQ